MRLSLEREVWGSNLGPVRSNTVLSTVRHRCNISSKEAVLPGRNDAEMDPANSSHARAATRGGGKRGRRPLNKNIAPLNCSAWPPKLPFPCGSSRWWQCFFFFLKPTKNWEKSRPIWRNDLFFWDQQRTRRKLDQPKNFRPPKKKFCPL